MLTVRQKEMLTELIQSNNYIATEVFTDRYSLSLRSIRQDLIVLQEWLLDLNIELDRHRKHGARLIISDEEKAFLLKRLESEPSYLGGADRKRHMILMILQGEGSVSIMEKKFAVSHNTMQNDVNELKKLVSDYQVTLVREKGQMAFNGEEIHIRQLFIETLTELFDEEKMMGVFASFKVEAAEINMILNQYFVFADEEELVKMLQGIEAELNVQYTGSSLYYLFIVLLVQLSRLQAGYILPHRWLDDKENLLDTLEYSAIKKNLKAYVLRYVPNGLPQSETAFSTLYFISAKKESGDLTGDYSFMKKAERIVLAFEDKTGVKLANRPKIIKGLALHLKPACHRMTYHLHIENALLEEVKREYQTFFDAVSQVVTEELKEEGLWFDEHEIGFITIHLCSGLEKRVSSPKKRVAIVCSSGIGTSSLLESSIRRKFPQASVQGVYSINDVKTLTKDNTDLILTTVSLMNTDVPWLKVSPFLNYLETTKVQALLGTAQMEENNEADMINIVKNVHSIVTRHAKVESESGLFRDLYHYFNGTNQSLQGHITILSDPSCLMLHREQLSWEQAIHELNASLVRLNKTAPAYADELIHYMTNHDHHFLIAEGIVFPHLLSEHVLDTGFAIMTFESPILFGPGEDSVWWIILLAARNQYEHLPAVELLLEVVNDYAILDTFKKENRAEAVWSWLRKREGEMG